jgi:hypothetical protein
MPYLGSFSPRIRVLTGWRAVVLGFGILVVAALLAFGVLVIIVPVLVVGAVASLFLPRSRIAVFRRPRRGDVDDVIEADYKVVETGKIEQGNASDHSGEK